MYGTVRWLNASDALGKLKKSSEVLTVVFIFKSAIAIIAQEQTKSKKKSKVSKYSIRERHLEAISRTEVVPERNSVLPKQH